jgi:hypothetical protein
MLKTRADTSSPAHKVIQRQARDLEQRAMQAATAGAGLDPADLHGGPCGLDECDCDSYAGE